jgi:hypothetical protein
MGIILRNAALRTASQDEVSGLSFIPSDLISLMESIPGS